ncbi:MAG: GNAT family N-acetyltransferase [Hyphomonadaceae bacterium]|nr:GNAT family N-acetyltransferase [Hyphomonadaceae bacterium]
MSAPPRVRRAEEAEKDIVGEVLHSAFGDEAGLNYWLLQGAAKERARRRFFHKIVRDGVHRQRELWLAEDATGPAGAAIWLGPGYKAYDFGVWEQMLLAPVLIQSAGIAGALRGLDLAERLEKQHPTVPHAHLVYLGVAPRAQGTGVGSAMLKHVLAEVDEARLPAFLECSSERNRALYARHGFEVTGELDLPGLHFWSMTRPAR